MKNNNKGYILPQATDIEKALLGALILEADSISKIETITKPEHFYNPLHEQLYDIIIYLIEISNSVDMLTITQEARNRNVLTKIGGAGYISELVNTVASAGHIDNHARIIRQKYFERESILLSNESARKIQSGEDAYDTSKWLTEQLDSLFVIEDEEGKLFKNTVADAMEEIRGQMDGTIHERRLTNTVFDNIFDFSPDEMIFLISSAKNGKTKTLLYVIINLLINNEDISIKHFSLEDGENRIIKNYASILTGIPLSKMEMKKKGEKLTEKEYTKIVEETRKIENYDVSLRYGSYTVEKVVSESLNFIKKRKDRFNLILIDNFNILVDAAGLKNQLLNENHVAGQLHQLRLKSNSFGYNTCIVVLDHLSKAMFDNGLERAYRPLESMLKGSVKKIEILTNLISINRVGLYPDLIEQYSHLPNKTLSDGKEWSMAEIMNQLSIYEVIKTRNAVCETGKPMQILADLGTMQFLNWEDMKHPPSSSSSSIQEEKSTPVIEQIDFEEIGNDNKKWEDPF